MKIYILLLLPLLIEAQSLKSLLVDVDSSNGLVVSKSYSAQAKKTALEASKKELYPTIDIGGYYQRSDEPSPIMPGTVYSGYVKVSYDVYTGGRVSQTIEQKNNEFQSSKHSLEATKSSIELAIVQDFYTIKTLEAKLMAREEAAKAVAAQLKRVEEFFEASLATSDDVDRLQSAYDSNNFAIESLKFEILSTQKALELKIGKEVTHLDNSKFIKPKEESVEELDSIKALRASKKSLINSAKIIESYTLPQVRIEDTYSIYGYADEPSLGPVVIEQLDNQNKLMATLNLRLYDFGVLREQKKSVLLEASALDEQINYQTKEQKIQLEVAKHRIKTAKLQIQSATSALKAANSALETITKKYNNGIVDNVAYLDALSSQTDSKATYEASLYNLELAYALYYYYNGKKLEEFLDE